VTAARIFISYRSSDGADKATALARDLGAVFGNAAVFLDKDDLGGGSDWRSEIGRAIGAKPILLLLLTPQLLEAVDAGGRRRIDDPADPVRRELEAALAAQARVIPVLTDMLASPPAAAGLPPPFDRLGDFTWRKLRAYDWPADVARLVADLQGAGVPTARRGGRRGWIGAAAAGSVGVAAVALWWWTSAPLSLSGRWQATLWQGESTVLHFKQQGDAVTYVSEPIRIAERADWAEYRAFWQERFKQPLDHIVYRGEGKWIQDPGTAPRIDIAFKVYPSPPGEGEPVDSGNLSATLAAGGRRLEGRIWLNGSQAEQAATLMR
jgi:hypothetical protein